MWVLRTPQLFSVCVCLCAAEKYYAISTHTHTHPLNYLNAPQRNGSRGFSSHFLFWLSQKTSQMETVDELTLTPTHTHAHPLSHTHTPTLACNCNKWILKHGALLVASMWAWQRHSFQLTVFSCFFSVFSVFFFFVEFCWCFAAL